MNPEHLFLGLWCIAVAVQYSYWVFPKVDESRSDEEEPWVSVIVCIHKSVFLLHRLITQLQMQSYEKFEVVIVNDGPDPEIGMYLSTTYWDRLRVVDFDSRQKQTGGKKDPLTAGIESAQYSWLLMTDADCVPDKHWIRSMVAARTKTSSLVLGFAPFFRQASLRNLMQRLDNLVIAVQYFGAALKGSAYMGVGRNLMYRKEIFTKVGGFKSHAHLASGDDDLLIQSARGNRANICIDPDSFVHSEAAPSWPAWMHQKRRHLSASSMYLTSAKMRTTLFALTWLVTWIGACFLLIFKISVAVPVLLLGIQWTLFSVVAWRLKQRDLIPWFPALAIIYCVVLCIFAFMLTRKSPGTWSL